MPMHISKYQRQSLFTVSNACVAFTKHKEVSLFSKYICVVFYSIESIDVIKAAPTFLEAILAIV